MKQFSASEIRRRPLGQPPLTRSASGPVSLHQHTSFMAQASNQNNSSSAMKPQMSLVDFENLLQENRISLGSLPISNAYDYFQQLESKLTVNGIKPKKQSLLDEFTKTADSLQQKSLGLGSGKNKPMIGTLFKRPPRIPPPPKTPKPMSQNDFNLNESAPVLDSSNVRMQRRLALDDIAALKLQSERVNQVLSANQLSGRENHKSRGGIEYQPNELNRRPSFNVPEMLARRNTFGERQSKNTRPVVNIIRRHTLNGMRKPPPPSDPPPAALQKAAQKKKPPPPSPKKPPEIPMYEPLPQHIPPEKNVESLGLQTRENFLLREKVEALTKKIKHMEADADLRQQDFNSLSKELQNKRNEVLDLESTLDTLRKKIDIKDKEMKKTKSETVQVRQESKTTSRKSQQRFDAAIDLFKGMLVDAKFPDLLQIIKTRIRVIVGVERAEVYITDKEKGELISYRERSAVRRPLPSADHLWMGRFPMDTGIVGAAIEEKNVHVVKDVEKDARFDALVDGIGSNGVRNLIAYPVLIRKRVVAVIVAVNKLTNGRVCGDDFTTTDVNAIQDFATLSTLAFNQREIQRTREKAKMRQIRRAKAGSGSDSDSDFDSESDGERASSLYMESR